ncbi:MAG: amidase domain-containing protein [Chloroflexota bacterium]
MRSTATAVVLGAALTFLVAAPALAYDPTAAANYAEQWWNSYNDGQWPRFNNDCTSFVSQASWAGGYDFDYGSGNPWYADQSYGAWYTSASWSFVKNNRGFHITKGDPIVTSVTGVKTASTTGVKGDIVYYSWFGDATFSSDSHATFAVVTAGWATSSPDYGLLIDGHTNARHKEYWTLYKFNIYWDRTIVQVVHPLASR